MVKPIVKRIARYLGKRENAHDFGSIKDPRGRRGRRWTLRSLMTATFISMVATEKSFRGVERITDDLSGCRKRFGVSRRVPDSTLARFFSKLDDESGLRKLLIDDIKRAMRRKALEPTELPIRTAAIDGQTLWCDDHEVDDPACQALSKDMDGYFRIHALHAVLISSSSQPCIDQQLVPKETNEMGALPDFIGNLVNAYGLGFIELVTLDAGMTSAENARMLTEHAMRYVMAVKENQPGLLEEARRLCGWGGHKQNGYVCEAKTDWERYDGKWIRRELFRSKEISGWPKWPSVRQVWRVKQTTKNDAGEVVHVENRYFVTSLPWDRLSGRDILHLVRLHWGVENGCHWTLDVVLQQDSRPWCTKGKALRMLSWLRLLAYNALQFLRRRYLRSTRHRTMPWADLARRIQQALTQADAWVQKDSAEVEAALS